ncbi:MAG: pseudouridine synthase [Bowdeniella nasicola]|nr:pseudouridine synthase [Bowdeniella nasicola]
MTGKSEAAPPHRRGLPARELDRPSDLPGDAPVRRWVAEALTELRVPWDAAGLERAFERGNVVDGEGGPVGADTPSGGLPRLFIHRDVADEGRAPTRLGVVARTEQWIAIHKPSGIATMPRGEYVARSAVVIMRRQLGTDDVVPAHRLDRLTSGVLLLITSQSARGAYQSLFAQRLVRKRYRALTSLPPTRLRAACRRGHEVGLHLVKERGSLTVSVLPGKEPNARTRLTYVGERTPGQRSGGERGSGARVGEWILEPTTGYTHQLRATLAHLGAPIVGDPLYPEVVPMSDPRWGRGLALHAEYLSFTDPLTGRLVDLTVAPPWDT